MKYGSEILSIIEAGIEGDKKKLRTYAELLVSKLPNDGHLKTSINHVLDGSYKNQPILEAKTNNDIFEKVEITKGRLKELEEREQMLFEINGFVGAVDGKPVEKVRAFVQMHITYGWCVNNLVSLVNWLKEVPPEEKIRYISGEMDKILQKTNESFKERFNKTGGDSNSSQH